MEGMSGAWNHVRGRGLERLSGAEKRIVSRALYKVATLIKNRRTPNGNWYRAVHNGGHTIGYICGYGCSVKTVLSAGMVPHGKKI